MVQKNPVAGRGREPSHRERWVAAKLSSARSAIFHQTTSASSIGHPQASSRNQKNRFNEAKLPSAKTVPTGRVTQNARVWAEFRQIRLVIPLGRGHWMVSTLPDQISWLPPLAQALGSAFRLAASSPGTISACRHSNRAAGTATRPSPIRSEALLVRLSSLSRERYNPNDRA
jgi:hypothetical protein